MEEMAFRKVASLSKFPPGSVTQVELNGDAYAICNADGELHVLDGICPHAGGPLGQGALHGNMLVCPWHAWEFDCRTGALDVDPDYQIPKFPVKVEGDDILIDVP
jgi:nitrite reductase/ring-hydroxylating ferredoxin subunit